MCGIAGIAGKGASPALAEAMVETLHHRGPDSSGTYSDPHLAMGQARLSIIDLATGDQPMTNEDGSLWVVYNGEIYNFPELKKELSAKGHLFSTTSDTEVLLHGWEEYGLDFLPRLDGIFAFALWDKNAQKLLLVRDYFGVKPLHYYNDQRGLRFGSEVKALLADPTVPREADKQALHDFLNLRYVPGERTLFVGIRRLPPGCWLSWEQGKIAMSRYAKPEPPRPEDHDEGYFMEGLRHYLSQAVKKQMISDVPLGVYLSGGMDSSSLVAYMSEHATGPVKTFSLGFNEPTDELDDARIVAERFGTEHHEMNLDADPLRGYPEVIWHAEVPKENILQGFLLARFAREHVKVVQGGLGGDEIFAGYAINNFVYSARGLLGSAPARAAEPLLAATSAALAQAQAAAGPLVADEYRRGMQLLLAMGDPERYYLILRNVWDHDPGAAKRFLGPELARAEAAPVHRTFDAYFQDDLSCPLEKVLWAEFNTKMVDDFLENEERTSMAHGLEVRVPFLDRDLVRFAGTIPATLLMKGNETKYLFRKAMRGVLPEHTLQKKKWGFTFNPYIQFRKDLKDVAARVLSKERVEHRGWFNHAFLRRILEHRPHPRLRWHYFFLWMAMGLEIWARMFLDGDPAKPELSLEAYFE